MVREEACGHRILSESGHQSGRQTLPRAHARRGAGTAEAEQPGDLLDELLRRSPPPRPGWEMTALLRRPSPMILPEDYAGIRQTIDTELRKLLGLIKPERAEAVAA